MPLPEGREPLTDQDMIVLLHDLARSFQIKDKALSKDLREIGDRLSDLSKNSQDFEIESLDPAKRSWYYDGNGMKRRKDE